MRKTILLFSFLSSFLIADTITSPVTTSFITGYVSETLDKNPTQSVILTMQSTIASYLESNVASEGVLDGMHYGGHILPLMVSEIKDSGNLNSETVRQGCKFAISVYSQDMNMTSAYKKEMEDGCLIGYASQLNVDLLGSD